MRLTLINQFYKPDLSPTAHLCASLAEHRAAIGDDVTVLTTQTTYAAQSNGRVNDNRVNVVRLFSTCLGSRTNLGRLLDWMSFYVPAIVHCAKMPPQDVVIAMTTPPFIAIAGWIHKLLNPKARLVLWNMDVYPEALERTGLVKTNSVVSRAMRSANRAIFRRLDALVSLDPAMEHLLLSQYMPRGREFRHEIIPNWESLELFPSAPTRAANPSREFTVLYLGNAGYGHEFRTIIEAAELLRNEPVKFLFIGGGVLRPWIARQKESRKLGNIESRNYVPKEQTPTVMANADAALITLEHNMLGVMSPSKLHANLAMGLPIVYVGPAGGNVDEAIARLGCGASLRPGNAGELAQFIRDIMGDSNRRMTLRNSARRAFDEAYCDRATLPLFDRLIDSLS